MKKVLVLGGTRFFGKRLVHKLIENGHDVTILTRGRTTDPFGQHVKRLQVDRENPEHLQNAIRDQNYDLVYDNICYSPTDAANAVASFSGKVGMYVLTSSFSVYDYLEKQIEEDDFNPYTYPIRMGKREDFDYQTGKRLAEAVFFQQKEMPVAAVRFPIVLGNDDYTKRLLFHIEHVRNGEPIGSQNADALRTYIHSEEAAEFLYWTGMNAIAGPINACSSGEMSLRQILQLIEKETGKRAIISSNVDEQHASPFDVPVTWTVSVAKANASGFSFWDLYQWLPELIAELCNKTYMEMTQE